MTGGAGHTGPVPPAAARPRSRRGAACRNHAFAPRARSGHLATGPSRPLHASHAGSSPRPCRPKASETVVDAETGFVYLRARYYDPATGQFISRDPLTAMTGSPYSYVHNNPLNATDPLGLFCVGSLCTPSVRDVGEWADRNAGTIATVASIASFAVPGAGLVAVGFGAWSAYGNVREGDYVGAALDVVGVAASGAGVGLSWRAGSMAKASRQAVLGRGYLSPWFSTEAARYASLARGVGAFSFGLSTLSEIRGSFGASPAAAATSEWAPC